MNKKVMFGIGVILLLLVIGLIIILVNYNNGKLDVDVSRKREVIVYNNVRVSDFIDDKNIKIVDDYEIDTDTVGTKNVSFQYKNKGFKYKDSFDIEVVDNEKPLILINSPYRVIEGTEIDLVNSFICGDNYDDSPKCYIEGEYDVNKVGSYDLKYIGIDSSGNKTEKDLTLIVQEKPKKNDNNQNSSTPSKTNFEEIVRDYKTDKTKIGIDVSKWQQEIDFEKVREAGAEFVMIKVAGEAIMDSGIEMDPYFENNIKKAIEAGLEVGVYYNSKANSIDDAKKEAKYVVNAIKDYEVTLGVAYDWESWGNFNKYQVSFHTLNKIADTFLNYVKEKGYRPLLYGSQYYLETIWDITKYDTWLARYSMNVTYKEPYVMWQLCNDGEIDGIDGDVDIDILYE